MKKDMIATLSYCWVLSFHIPPDRDLLALCVRLPTKHHVHALLTVVVAAVIVAAIVVVVATAAAASAAAVACISDMEL